MKRLALAGWLALCGVGAHGAADAQPAPAAPWALCPAEPLAALLTTTAADGADRTEDQDVEIDADSVEAGRERAVLRGNVRVRRGDLLLRAPELTLDRAGNRISASDIGFGSPSVALRGARGEYAIDDGIGVFEQAEYFVAARHARGSAASVRVEREAGVSELDRVSYTTCAASAEFWRLDAQRLQLDQQSGRGSAEDVTLRLLDVPVLYLPWLSFPIDDRRHSGFLTPRFGYASDSGLDLRIPYYWNIAPNQDLTLAPRLLARRGLALGAEYRYLGRGHSGEINAEYLPHDRQRDDDRYALKVRHRAAPVTGLYTDLLFQEVSDDDYIDDLSNSLALLSPNYLERHFDVSYFAASRVWSVLGRLQDFQTIDAELFGSDDQPYGRLPQLLFDGGWTLPAPPGVPADSGIDLRAGLRAELTRFDTDSARVTGRRVDLHPSLGAALERPWGFIRPRVGYRYTTYRLDYPSAPASAADSGAARDGTPDRAAPVASLDTGLFLERPTDDGGWLGAGLLTLEPRLFYLYVPERDQDDIPLFDTDDLDPSLAFLFLDNRFTGADRLGDANQISASLTSRFLPRGGGERLRLSVGQAFYFDRPSVTLAGSRAGDRDTSDLFAEADFAVNADLKLRGTLRWDPDRDRTGRSALDLRYRPDDRRLVNLSHRFAREELEQLDLAFLWPVNDRWRALGRWNYSLKESNVVDAFAGFEYDDCCWSLRLLARHHRDEPDDDRADNSLFLELELKGLAGLGNRIDRLLEDSIFGYESVR